MTERQEQRLSLEEWYQQQRVLGVSLEAVGLALFRLKMFYGDQVDPQEYPSVWESYLKDAERALQQAGRDEAMAPSLLERRERRSGA